MKIKWKKILYFKWFKRLYVLYIFGVVLNFRPSLPFFYEFLKTDKKFSENETIGDILPMLFYSTSVAFIPVFLLMDFVKFSPFIIISTLTGIVSTCLFIWTDSLIEMEVAQAFYGCQTAAEIAYYVCVYSNGKPESYQKLTSAVRAAPLVGKFIAGFLAQVFVSVDALSYKSLHYFNLAALILATILNIFLPPTEGEKPANSEKQDSTSPKITSICQNLTQSFPNKYVVKWSIWSILTICGYNQISTYVQRLWSFVQSEHDTFKYNGALEGINCIFALAATILGGFATFDWKFKGDLILSMTSLVEAFMLLFMAQITSVALNSMFYVILGFMYHFTMTILLGEIAKFLKKGCFGLVFGLIALFGWSLSSGMVYLLNDNERLKFDDYQSLFMVYGFYHLGVSVLFIIVGLSYWFAKHTYE